mmetsp:Transcript_14590/g.37234  ORF Transcript_14590/g.37234 Transcript_14590/m.37234 type:complete len:82 (-) Transcript_14590:198-443(-)
MQLRSNRAADTAIEISRIGSVLALLKAGMLACIVMLVLQKRAILCILKVLLLIPHTTQVLLTRKKTATGYGDEGKKNDMKL